MVVYVRLRVKSTIGISKELIVLVNGGAHSESPVIVVDENIGRELGFSSGEVYEVSTVDSRRNVYVVKDFVELELLGENREVLSKIKADLVVHPGLEEPLITDATIDMLGIKVESFYKGLWRHVNDPSAKIRRSAK